MSNTMMKKLNKYRSGNSGRYFCIKISEKTPFDLFKLDTYGIRIYNKEKEIHGLRIRKERRI